MATSSTLMKKLLCLVITSTILLKPTKLEGAITCGQVTSDLVGCVGYLSGTIQGPPSPSCCNGVKSLNAAANITRDRQAACQCLKQLAASTVTTINPTLAAGLPSKCGVSIPYKISTSTNCKSIK